MLKIHDIFTTKHDCLISKYYVRYQGSSDIAGIHIFHVLSPQIRLCTKRVYSDEDVMKYSPQLKIAKEDLMMRMWHSPHKEVERERKFIWALQRFGRENTEAQMTTVAQTCGVSSKDEMTVSW